MDDYHGVKIADPYRGLENADAPVHRKIRAAGEPADVRLSCQAPRARGHQEAAHRICGITRNSPASTKPETTISISIIRASQNQSVLYVMDSLNGAPRVLLDPNTYPKRWHGGAGRRVGAAGTESCSRMPWRRRVRIGRSGACATWRRARIPSDLIQWTKGSSVSWAPDDRGFYYSRYPEPPPEKLLTVAALGREGLLPQAGRSAVRGQADLRAAGSSELDYRSAGDGRQPVPAALHVHGRSGEESAGISGPAGRRIRAP